MFSFQSIFAAVAAITIRSGASRSSSTVVNARGPAGAGGDAFGEIAFTGLRRFLPCFVLAEAQTRVA